MQIRVSGEMTIHELRQAIFEKLREIEDEYFVRYSRGASVYINPTNGFGCDVVPVDRLGKPVSSVFSDGPYRSAADSYDGKE